MSGLRGGFGGQHEPGVPRVDFPLGNLLSDISDHGVLVHHICEAEQSKSEQQ